MQETTAANLRIQQRAFRGDADAHDAIESLIRGLRAAPSDDVAPVDLGRPE